MAENNKEAGLVDKVTTERIRFNSLVQGEEMIDATPCPISTRSVKWSHGRL